VPSPAVLPAVVAPAGPPSAFTAGSTAPMPTSTVPVPLPAAGPSMRPSDASGAASVRESAGGEVVDACGDSGSG